MPLLEESVEEPRELRAIYGIHAILYTRSSPEKHEYKKSDGTLFGAIDDGDNVAT